MAGLAEMLRDGGGPDAGPGGPPPGAGGPPPGGDADEASEGKMPPDQAIKILQHFQIPPDPKVLQMVCDAAEAGMALLQQQGQGEPGAGAPPPGPGAGGPPPPPGA